MDPFSPPTEEVPSSEEEDWRGRAAAVVVLLWVGLAGMWALERSGLIYLSLRALQESVEVANRAATLDATSGPLVWIRPLRFAVATSALWWLSTLPVPRPRETAWTLLLYAALILGAVATFVSLPLLGAGWVEGPLLRWLRLMLELCGLMVIGQVLARVPDRRWAHASSLLALGVAALRFGGELFERMVGGVSVWWTVADGVLWVAVSGVLTVRAVWALSRERSR